MSPLFSFIVSIIKNVAAYYIFIFPNVRKTPPGLLPYLIVIYLLMGFRDGYRLTISDT